jgi:hypothetical protein
VVRVWRGSGTSTARWPGREWSHTTRAGQCYVGDPGLVRFYAYSEAGGFEKEANRATGLDGFSEEGCGRMNPTHTGIRQ